MCGIAGIINLKPNTIEPNKQTDLLQRMLNQLHHRGPDETNILTCGQYSIGTTRLKIVGRNAGKQPFYSKTSALVFNGEIYNYETLAKKYLDNNIDTSSDGNVLFHFLIKYGLNKLNCLNGVFSFCYTTKENIYLARDRFGEKPLYYTVKDGYLLFASEIKAFIGVIDFELQLPKFYKYLETALEGETIFKNIYEVKPSTYISIDRKNMNISTHSYYSIFDVVEEKGSEKQLKEKLRWLVEDSVKIRSNTDLPYGMYISGGVDSSIIALLTKPKFLLTYLPQTKLIDREDGYANIIASHLTKSVYIKVKPSGMNFLNQLIQTVYSNGGPTTTLAAYSQYRLSQTLSYEGVRLAFSGLGIDEFLNGYVRHAIPVVDKTRLDLPIFTRYKALISLANKSKARSKSILYATLLNRYPSLNVEFTELIESVFSKTKNYSEAVSICDALFTLPPLLHTDDHLNMAFGIENRAPFLDYRLVNFALGLPIEMKIRTDSEGKVNLKYLLREAFEDILPKEIYSRKDKIGFSSNVNDLLRNGFGFLVHNSKLILEKNAPDVLFAENNNQKSQPYTRWEYQIVQLAITYLLFCRKYSLKDVELILSKGDLNNGKRQKKYSE